MNKQLTPLKIVLIYATAGVCWILFSDLFVFYITKDPLLGTKIKIAKGWIFILVTSILLYSIVMLYARQRSQSENKLKEEKDFSTNIIKRAPAVICGIASDGRTNFINPAGEAITGYSAEELIGKNWWNLFYPGDEYRQVEQLLRDFSKGDVEDYEMTLTTRDGNKRIISWNSANRFDTDGNIIQIIGFGNDITERKIAEEALQDSEVRYRALIDASSQVLYRMSPDWSEMRQLKGGGFIADTERPNRNWLQEYIHPDDQKQVMEVSREAVRTGTVFELEHRVLRADGKIGWTASRAVPLRNAAGELVEWFGAASDITERKEAEERLTQSEEHAQEQSAELQALLDAMPAGVLIAHDPECRKVTCNPTWLEILGATEGQNPLKDTACERLRGEFRRGGVPIPSGQLPVWVACFTGKPVVGDIIEVVQADGISRHFYGNAVPLFDSHNAVRGAVSVLLDITELREAHDNVKLYAKKLEESNKELDNFASIAAHDLHAPLRAVSGFTNLLQKRYKETIDAEADKYISYIVEGTERMTHLIND